MTFKQAKKNLKKIAGQEYHSMSFELTEYSDGGFKSECCVYIHAIGRFTGDTWEEAFLKLNHHMHPQSEYELLKMAA